jgi:hypothetical protein
MNRVIKSLARESVTLLPKLTLILDQNGFATLKKGLDHEPGFLLKETRSSITIELTAYYPVRATCELQKKDFIETVEIRKTEY